MDPRPANPPANSAAPPLTATVAPENGDTNSAAPSAAPADGAAYPFLSPPQQPDEIGRLGPYRVLGVLGRGGMGVVFRAEETQLKRHIALKVMLPEVAADARAKARFQREAQAQAQVEHENVAVIHQVGEANGVPFIAMPLLKGQTLGAALKQNPRPPLSELVRIGREIAEGLAAAHEKGLVHRDIKPGNVWLDGNKRRVRILDFGLARSEATATVDASEPVTASGAIVGTPAYMSPEQARGEKIDHRSDLFSLGVVLYQMATGRLPFTGANTFTVLLGVTEHHPPAVHEVIPDFPLTLSELVWRLMAKEPVARPQTAEEAATALGALEGNLSLPRVQVLPLSSVVTAPTGPDPWADIDLTEPGEPEPEDATEDVAPAPARGAAPKSRRAILLWGALGAVVLASGALLAFALFGARPKAKLLLDADDATWEVVVKQDGKVVRDRTREREFVLPPGEYAVEVANAPVGLQIVPPRVTLANGGQEHVRVWVDKPKPPRPKEPPPDKESPAPAALPLTAENRRALEAVLAMGGSLHLLVDGKEVTIAADGKLPPGPFGVRYVILTGVTSLDQSIERLRALPPVSRGLTLTKTGITDAEMARLVTFPGLAKLPALNLTETNVTDAGLADVAKLTALTHLDLTRARVKGAGLAHLRGLKLETLTLHMCGVDDAAMDHLADMTSLTRLWLMYTPVSDAGLAKLSKLTNLVYLHPGAITDASADVLLGFRKLTTLHLIGSKFGGAGLKKLAALPALSIVAAADCAIDDAGLAAFKELPALATLGLNGSKGKVTDAGLAHLAECAGLRQLNLKDTKATEAGVKALTEKLPLCQIVWDGATIEPRPLNEVSRASVAALLKGGAKVTVIDGGKTRFVASAEEWKEADRVHQITIPFAPGNDPLADPLVLAVLRAFPAEAWQEGHRIVTLQGAVTPAHLRVAVRAAGLRHAHTWEIWDAQLPDEALAELAALPPKCDGLVLKNAGTTDAALKSVASFTHLTRLSIVESKLTSAGLAALRNWPLISLDLSANPGIDDATVEHLAAITTLKQINLKGTKVTKAGVEKLAAALPLCKITWDGGVIEPKTQAEVERKAAQALLPYSDLTLKLPSGKEIIVKKGEKFPDEAFVVQRVAFPAGLPKDVVDGAIFPALANLRSLTQIYGWTTVFITGDQVERLSRMPLAETLTGLSLAFELTPATLDSLRRFPQLRGLHAYAPDADADLLARLVREHPELSGLVIEFDRKGNVSARGLDVLAKLPVTYAGVGHCSVVDVAFVRLLAARSGLFYLTLFGCPIGDDAVKELPQGATLTDLVLTETQVTDAGLEHAAGIASLRTLQVQKTKVTKAGVEKLAKQRPDVKIHWDGGVIEPAKKP